MTFHHPLAAVRHPGTVARALLAAGLVLATGAALACTPPRPLDIALELGASVEGGGAVLPGSRGRLQFTAANLRAGFGPEGFEVRQAAVDPAAPQGAPIRLSNASGSACFVEDRERNDQGQPARYQAVVAPRDRNQPWPRTCHVDFEVLPSAEVGQAVRYTLRTQDWCGMDVDTSNNDADLVLGVVPPPAGQPAIAAPLAAWPLLLLVLAMLVVVFVAQPRALRARARD